MVHDDGSMLRRRSRKASGLTGALLATPTFVILACMLALAPFTATHAAADPAVTQVQTLSDALLKAMKAGRAQSLNERYRSLEPVIQQSFALPLMTRVAVGPDWAKFTPEQQKDTVAAFMRYTVANYTYNFKEYDGQKFEIDPGVSSRGEDKVVQTRIISTDGTSTSLVYRMRQVDGSWKIIDVFSNGVSELILQRTDFGAAITNGGPPALIAHLEKSSDNLMK
jgi:phospholipid transport system substrate-binding protein